MDIDVEMDMESGVGSFVSNHGLFCGPDSVVNILSMYFQYASAKDYYDRFCCCKMDLCCAAMMRQRILNTVELEVPSTPRSPPPGSPTATSKSVSAASSSLPSV